MSTGGYSPPYPFTAIGCPIADLQNYGVAPLNYLQLCQRAVLDCEVTGSLTTVTSQSGNLARIVNWTADAYVELQNRHQGRWRWLRHGWTVNTVADDDTYAYGDCTDTTSSAVISRHRRWLIQDPYDPPKCYLQSSGVGTEYWLTYVPWSSFKTIYKIGSQTSAAPQFITIDPQNNIVLGPAPSAVYVVSGEYQRSAQILSSDNDTPEIPSDFHTLIVYLTMQKYAGHTGAEEKMFRGTSEGSKVMRQLEQDQLPEVELGAALA